MVRDWCRSSINDGLNFLVISNTVVESKVQNNKIYLMPGMNHWAVAAPIRVFFLLKSVSHGPMLAA